MGLRAGRLIGWVLLAASALALPACDKKEASNPPPTPLPTIRLAAASSLQNGLGETSAKAALMPFVPEFDASSRLAAKLEAGAPYDVVITADEEWMDWLVVHRLVIKESRKVIARNRLVLVLPADSKFNVAGPADIEQLPRIAMADNNVPLGRYGEQALRALGVWNKVEKHVVRGDSARSTLAWVTRGEVDGAIVYATDGTDALGQGNTKFGFRFEESLHTPIRYVAAVSSGSKQKAAAAGFITRLLGADVQSALLRHRFQPPEDRAR